MRRTQVQWLFLDPLASARPAFPSRGTQRRVAAQKPSHWRRLQSFTPVETETGTTSPASGSLPVPPWSTWLFNFPPQPHRPVSQFPGFKQERSAYSQFWPFPAPSLSFSLGNNPAAATCSPLNLENLVSARIRCGLRGGCCKKNHSKTQLQKPLSLGSSSRRCLL